MTLRALIRGGRRTDSGPSVTATLATVATLDKPQPRTVATVATVTVAPRRNSALFADPWADCAAALQFGMLHQCRACRHFDTAVPAGSDDLGVAGVGWCRRFGVASHPLVPFVCDGYTARGESPGI